MMNGLFWMVTVAQIAAALIGFALWIFVTTTEDDDDFEPIDFLQLEPSRRRRLRAWILKTRARLFKTKTKTQKNESDHE